MLQLFIITIVILGIAFLGIGVKMLFKKGGQFTKSCASAELTNGKRVGCVCSVESSGDDSGCQYYQEHHGDEIK